MPSTLDKIDVAKAGLQFKPSVIDEVFAWNALSRLEKYVTAHNYEGADPFDGLNSWFLKAFPFLNFSVSRLALMQFLKRSSINFRPLLGVPDEFNPKGGALFLMGYVNLLNRNYSQAHENEAYILFQRLKHLAIPTEHGVGWGYHFDWQARAFYAPTGTPNLVTSVYVGRALLRYYQYSQNPEVLKLALAIADFIALDMVFYETDETLCFHYIPGKDAEVHNANLLGAAYLAQASIWMDESKRENVHEKIRKALRFSLSDLNEDGSWPYGTKSFHRWVDNFHTAYNIENLVYLIEILSLNFDAGLFDKIVRYYLFHLFEGDGTPKYYAHALYPIDIHVLAQVLVLFALFRQKELALYPERMAVIEQRVKQLLREFQDAQGYFYYQKLRYGWNKIAYMRWGQAWMFYALSECLMI